MNEQLTVIFPPGFETYECIVCGALCGKSHPVRVFSPFHLGRIFYTCTKCAKRS